MKKVNVKFPKSLAENKVSLIPRLHIPTPPQHNEVPLSDFVCGVCPHDDYM